MDSALVFEWKPTASGGAMLKPALKAEFDKFFSAAAGDGRVTSYTWFVSGNGDRLFLVAQGPSDSLGRITENPAFVNLKTMVQLSHADFHVSLCSTGASVDTMLAVQEAAKAAAP
jgi:hypothetical protein